MDSEKEIIRARLRKRYITPSFQSHKLASGTVAIYVKGTNWQRNILFLGRLDKLAQMSTEDFDRMIAEKYR